MNKPTTPTPTPEPMTGKRARCGMPCLTHPHACDRSPKHTSVHRDAQQKGDHTCEWGTPGPGDVPALLAALEKSRSGARELGQIVVFLTDLMKDAFQRGGSDPIGALHMLGNHLAEALVSDEDADEFNRAYRALEQRRDEVKRLRADLEQCRSMLRESERTAADLKGHVERQRGQDEKLLAALERDEAERNTFRAERDEAVATVEKALADVEAIVAERDRLADEKAKLSATVAAFPDAHNAANIAHARRQRDALAEQVERIRAWVNGDVVTARNEFGSGYREAIRDVRDLLGGTEAGR